MLPFSPGGGYDLYSRLIQPFFEKETGARGVVDNVAGAGGRLGALHLRQAPPDGQTLGILAASGILVAGLTAEENAPDLLADFTLFARIVRNSHIWATAQSGNMRSFDDVLSTSAQRPVLFTVNELGSTAFVGSVVAADILGLRAGFVTGYPGSVDSMLAAARGEVDIVAQSYETLAAPVTQGELRSLLQISDEPIGDGPMFRGVPLLGGEQGVAARMARKRGADPKPVIRDSTALVNLIGEGRLIAGPPGLPDALRGYLEEVLARICAGSAFLSAATRAGRSVEYAPGDAVRATLRASVNDAKRFVPLVMKVTRDVRNGTIPQ
jgi:tripartite-type tricarboxylate transporter receptor subunit TctC